MESLLKIFPLPSAPSHQCRDEFLKELLEPYKGIGDEEQDSTSQDQIKTVDRVRFKSSLFQPEERLIDHYLRQRDSVRPSIDMRYSRESRIIAPDVNQMLQDRYDELASSISFMAVIFELNEVTNWVNIARRMWRMKSNVDKSLRMFSWSIQDYFSRFGLRTQSYLDAIELELKGQMDCFKFCIDLKEIIRLVDAVCEDFKKRRDICTSSMLLIRDAEIDINELLTKSEKEARIQELKLAKAMLNTPLSADPDKRRQKALQKKISYLDFIAPIEARYRINWAQSALDQSIKHDNIASEEMNVEVDYWSSRAVECLYLWEVSSMAYDMEIDGYRRSIKQVEDAYEKDMLKCENDILLTQNRLYKVKEDLIFKKKQVPMFHARIEEVQQILSANDEKNIFPVELTERKSTRLSKKKPPGRPQKKK